MEQLSRKQSIVMLLGAVLMVVGAGLYVFGEHTVAPIVFAPGTLAFAAMQWQQKYTGNDLTLRRLRRIILIGAALFVVAALLMVENSYKIVYPLFAKTIDGWNVYAMYIHNNWVVALLVAAVLQLYSTHRISAELKKRDGQSGQA